MQLEHGEDPMHRTTSRRQLEFQRHAGKAPDLFDQRLGRSWTKRHTKRGHGRIHHPPELGNVPDGLLVDGFRLAPGIAGLAQGGCILLPGCSRLLQLGLNL
jgi:hypothetical protein